MDMVPVRSFAKDAAQLVSVEKRVTPPTLPSPPPRHAPRSSPGRLLRPLPAATFSRAPDPAPASPLSFGLRGFLLLRMTPRDPSHLSLLLSGSPEHACIQGTTPTNPKQRGTHRRRSGSYSNGEPEVCQQPEAELRSESSAASGVCQELVRFESTWSRGREGRGLKAGGGGDEGSPFPGAGASGSFASSGGCGRACCEMDTPPLSGSDSDSDDSLVTDKEVGVIRARGAARGRGVLTPRY